MVRLALAPLLLVGCAEVFGLEPPVHEGDGQGSGSGSGSGGVNEACTGVVVDGTCYERFDQPMVWYAAREECEAIGATLAKMESAEVRTAVGKLLALDEEVFLGANDEAEPGVYLWLDLSPVTFAGWLPTQPDADVDEHCIILHNAGAIGWEDDKCYDPRGYICERPL